MSGNASQNLNELGQCSELVGCIAKAMALVAPKMTKQARQSWVGISPTAFAEVLEKTIFLPANHNPENLVIHVDRSVTPSYPDWMKQVMHPELANTGSAEYDISSVKLWLHPDQDNGGTTTGKVIYKHLEDNEMLQSCLNLQDGLAIQAKGIESFRKHFSGKAVFLWGSVVRGRYGRLRVPYLVERDGRVVVRWDWLGRDWLGRDPALRFAS